MDLVGNQIDRPINALDQLERLKRLLDEEAISQEGFDRLKAQLLASG